MLPFPLGFEDFFSTSSRSKISSEFVSFSSSIFSSSMPFFSSFTSSTGVGLCSLLFEEDDLVAFTDLFAFFVSLTLVSASFSVVVFSSFTVSFFAFALVFFAEEAFFDFTAFSSLLTTFSLLSFLVFFFVVFSLIFNYLHYSHSYFVFENTKVKNYF